MFWLGLSPEVLAWLWAMPGGTLETDPAALLTWDRWGESRPQRPRHIEVAFFPEDPPAAGILPPLRGGSPPGTIAETTPGVWPRSLWYDQVRAHGTAVSSTGRLVVQQAAGHMVWHVEWDADQTADHRFAILPARTRVQNMNNVWALRLALVTDAAEADRVAEELALLCQRQPNSVSALLDALASPLAAPWWRALSHAGWVRVLDSSVPGVRAQALLALKTAGRPAARPLLPTNRAR